MYSVVCTLYILLFQRLSVGIVLIAFINLVEQLIVVVSSAMAGIRESRLRPIRISTYKSVSTGVEFRCTCLIFFFSDQNIHSLIMINSLVGIK